MPPSYYIGLISGTSVDGIDCVCVDLSDGVNLVAALAHPYPQKLADQIRKLCSPRTTSTEIEELGVADVQVGQCFAEAVTTLLETHNIDRAKVKAIGSHGQTVRHRTNQKTPFTLQIGDPNTIAELTGLTTVADFRRRDLVLGGEGAPLLPAFHRAVFSDAEKARVILNLGGIANITRLVPGDRVSGFDTGPASTLMDAWIHKHQGLSFDEGGRWAASGSIIDSLLLSMLGDSYFQKSSPKSTGREYFNLEWLAGHLESATEDYKPCDVQRTLLAATVESVAYDVAVTADAGELFVCGGGVHNQFLMESLSQRLPDWQIASTEKLGVNPDWVEAMGFAWLAKRTLDGLTGNVAEVTGASKESVLGGVYPAPTRH